MALFRQIHCSFWEDPDILETFSRDERYFFLYLMTNPHTTQCGIYKLTYAHMELETGFEREELCTLLDDFENKYQKIRYNPATREIAIRNWLKYNYSKSPKVQTCIKREIKEVKDRSLIPYILQILREMQQDISIDTLLIEYTNSINSVGIPTLQSVDTVSIPTLQTEKKNKKNNNNIRRTEEEFKDSSLQNPKNPKNQKPPTDEELQFKQLRAQALYYKQYDEKKYLALLQQHPELDEEEEIPF